MAKPAAKTSIGVDGYWGSNTTTRLQKVYGTVVDVEVWHQHNWNNPGLTTGWKYDNDERGSKLIKAMQRALGANPDGELGPKTISAMQRRAGTPVDGVISAGSKLVKYIQNCVYASKQPF